MAAKNNSGFDAAAVTGILARILAAKSADVKDFRTALATAAGKGIAKDEVEKIFVKAGFTTDAGVAPVTVNTVRYVLVLGDGWAKIEDAAKKALASAATTAAPITGNWTSLANAIAKRQMDGMDFAPARDAAIAAAKTQSREAMAKAVAARAAKLLREVQADLAAAISEDKLRAKVDGTIQLIEKMAL